MTENQTQNQPQTPKTTQQTKQTNTIELLRLVEASEREGYQLYRDNASRILEYAWQLKKNGRAEATIQTVSKRLQLIAKNCNLNEPEQVKAFLATAKWMNSTKFSATIDYNGYIKFIGKTWEKPTYKPDERIPFIPTEQEIDQLITASGTKGAALLQLLKETGARIGEATMLKWIDIDLERKTINITPEKHSNPRILPMTEKLKAMLGRLARENNLVFTTSKHGLRITFEDMRARTALKMSNPRLKKITFHTFRHWKGTMEYHKTKDIIHVKTVLGHKDIESTMTYINIEAALFLQGSDEWTCKAAKNATEAATLIEAGFEYVQQIESISLYRKRK